MRLKSSFTEKLYLCFLQPIIVEWLIRWWLYTSSQEKSENIQVEPSTIEGYSITTRLFGESKVFAYQFWGQRWRKAALGERCIRSWHCFHRWDHRRLWQWSGIPTFLCGRKKYVQVKLLKLFTCSDLHSFSLMHATSMLRQTHMPLANSSDSSHASLTCTKLNSPVMSLSPPSLKASNAFTKCVELRCWW